MKATAIVDCLFSLFGYARVRFSQETGSIFSALADLGAVKCGETAMPTTFTNFYFRVRGRKIKLTIEDYQDTIVTGPIAIVRELSQRISDRARHHDAG